MSDLRQLMADSKGLPSAFRRDHPIGTVWSGVVQRVDVRQVRDDDGNPETWDDGNPKQQVVIAIQTDQRDPERTGDDGVRGIYVKWWGEQRKALRECLQNAGVDDIEPGGLFAAKYTGDGPQPQNRMYSPAKLMQFEYKPPSPTAGLFNPGGNSNGAPAAPAAAAQPDPWTAVETTPAAPAPAPAAAPTPPPPVAAEVISTPPTQPAAADPMALLSTIKAFLALGMTDEQIAGATGANTQAITAVRSLPA